MRMRTVALPKIIINLRTTALHWLITTGRALSLASSLAVGDCLKQSLIICSAFNIVAEIETCEDVTKEGSNL